MPKYIEDKAFRFSVFLFAFSSFLVLFLIVFFVVKGAIPAFREIGFFSLVFGKDWYPAKGEFGLLSMIVGSFYVTFLSLLMAVPLGVGCAIFLSELSPRKIRGFVRRGIELLVGIPSVVYGLVGMVLLVPLVREVFGTGSGSSVLAASIVLAVMILPTIVSISEDSMRAVPLSYREAALSLGATRWQMIRGVILPAARTGIITSIVLGMGRAIGETMAMIMVIGNSPVIPISPLSPARTLTGNIAVEIKAAVGIHESALFATGVILLIIILFLNSIAFTIRRGR